MKDVCLIIIEMLLVTFSCSIDAFKMQGPVLHQRVCRRCCPWWKRASRALLEMNSELFAGRLQHHAQVNTVELSGGMRPYGDPLAAPRAPKRPLTSRQNRTSAIAAMAASTTSSEAVRAMAASA